MPIRPTSGPALDRVAAIPWIEGSKLSEQIMYFAFKDGHVIQKSESPIEQCFDDNCLTCELVSTAATY